MIFLQVSQIALPPSKPSRVKVHFLVRDRQISWCNQVLLPCNKIKWRLTMEWFSSNPKGHLSATLTQGLTRNRNCIGRIRMLELIKLVLTYGAHLRIMVSRMDLTSMETRTAPQTQTTAVVAAVQVALSRPQVPFRPLLRLLTRTITTLTTGAAPRKAAWPLVRTWKRTMTALFLMNVREISSLLMIKQTRLRRRRVVMGLHWIPVAPLSLKKFLTLPWVTLNFYQTKTLLRAPLSHQQSA